MHFDDDGTGRVRLRDGGAVLAEYVYRPVEPRIESPRSYALLRTRGGLDATAYRPDDHVWHKGLSLALPVVGEHNFWGGPSYRRGVGYVQLPNNGAQVHRAFAHADGPLDAARIEETLDWSSADGEPVLGERRSLTARPVDEATWALTWRSALRNRTAAPLAFGSPTTEGRDNAGYAGLFWRGPSLFTGGDIVAPGGPVGDAARGEPGPWLAFQAPAADVGVLMLDAADPVTPAGNPWFARSAEYAGLNPAPFFFHETVLPPGGTLVLAAAVVVGDRDVARHADTVGATLVAELRHPASVAAHTPEEVA